MKLINWKSNNSTFDLFDNFNQYFNNAADYNYGDIKPNIDISDNDKKYFLSLDMPGISKKDIEITVNDGIINITAERKNKNESSSYSKTTNSKYARSFYVPDDADYKKIKATTNDGVLLVEISKLSKLKKNIKRIEIS